MSDDARRRRWRELVEEHRRALAELEATAESLGEAAWSVPRAEGKWAPAQIVEHMRLTCETMQAELEGRGGFRVRTGWLRRQVLKVTVLPRILSGRRMPEGAPAVREIRPQTDARLERRPTLDALRERATSLVAALEAADPEHVAAVTHPFFGRLDPLKGLDLATVHAQHHHAQLLEVAERPTAAAPPLTPATARP